MKVELKWYHCHLGDHDNPKGRHRLDEPRAGCGPLDLPWYGFLAVSMEAADVYRQRLNSFADGHALDGMDMIQLLAMHNLASGESR